MFSTHAGNGTLNLLFRGVAFSAPSRVWVSLHTADPGPSGTAEVSTGAWPAYVRIDPAGGGDVGGGFSAAAEREIANLLDLEWPAVDGAGPVVVSHYAIWDAATGGNCLHSGALVTSRTLAVSDEFIIRAGNLVIRAYE